MCALHILTGFWTSRTFPAKQGLTHFLCNGEGSAMISSRQEQFICQGQLQPIHLISTAAAGGLGASCKQTEAWPTASVPADKPQQSYEKSRRAAETSQAL